MALQSVLLYDIKVFLFFCSSTNEEFLIVNCMSTELSQFYSWKNMPMVIFWSGAIIHPKARMFFTRLHVTLQCFRG